MGIGGGDMGGMGLSGQGVTVASTAVKKRMNV